MKIGFCAKLDRLEEVAAAGFDYIEPSVTSVTAMGEEEFAETLRRVGSGPIPCPAFNVLFPKTLSLLAPETTDETIREYLRPALEKVARLGGRVVVFGSGASRKRPVGMSYGEAFRRLTEVTRIIGETAGEFGITVVIEPLNRSETDMINSVAEGADLMAAANHPQVKLLADYFHIAVEHQAPEDLARLGGIDHCHIATEIGRRIPLEAEEGFRKMFAAMKQTDYRGLISVEGKAEDLGREGPVAAALLKKLWEEA